MRAKGRFESILKAVDGERLTGVAAKHKKSGKIHSMDGFDGGHARLAMQIKGDPNGEVNLDDFHEKQYKFGFKTTHRPFVDREEGLKVARQGKQVGDKLRIPEWGLIAEDVTKAVQSDGRPFGDSDVAALWDSAKPEHRHAFVKKHGFHDLTAEEASRSNWKTLQPAVKQAVGPAMQKTAVTRYGADAARTLPEAFGHSLRGVTKDVVDLGRALVPRKLSKSLKAGEPEPNTPTHADYRYHATSLDRAHSIADEGLRPHKPWHGTDQNTWPDGGTERRSYFTDQAHVAWHFAPEDGKAALLRVHKNHAKFQTERGTGDFFVREPVAPDKVEIMDHKGDWHPMSKLSEKEDVIQPVAKTGDLQKSSTAPFQPTAPHPSKPRAPRRPTPFDPVAGHNMYAAPFKFKPHRLGDLWQLHLQDKYDIQKVKKVGMQGGVAAQRQNVRPPAVEDI